MENTFMSNLMNGLSTTLIGMLIVFFGLLILILCITVMHKVMNRGPKNREIPAEEKVIVSGPAPEPAVAEEEEDDSELIAVISAAIAAVWDDQESGFVVRRVRRISNSPLSARLARDEQMYSHF